MTSRMILIMLKISRNLFSCLSKNRLGLLPSIRGSKRRHSGYARHCLVTVPVISLSFRKNLYSIGTLKSRWLLLREGPKSEMKCRRGCMGNVRMNLFMAIKTVIMRWENRRSQNQQKVLEQIRYWWNFVKLEMAYLWWMNLILLTNFL